MVANRRFRTFLTVAVVLAVLLGTASVATAATRPAARVSAQHLAKTAIVARPVSGPDVRSVVSGAVRVADAFDPGDDEQTGAVAIALSTVYTRNFTFDAYGAPDIDWFSISLQANHTYEVWVDCADSVDPYTEFSAYDSLYGDYFTVVANDDRRVVATPQTPNPGCLIRYTVGTTGTYYIDIADIWSGGGTPGASNGSYTLEVDDLGTGLAPASETRMDGADRYEVAKNVAFEANGGSWAGINTVIIASGLDKAAADPLTAGGLAGVMDAPILLINQSSGTKQLPSYTRNAITAIHAANPGVDFYLVGGTASCPTWVQTRIQAITGTSGHVFERLAGADRYACSSRIAREVRENSAEATGCLIANGETSAFFYDALAAAPLSYTKHWPILLVKKNSIPSATGAEVANYSMANRYIVGNSYEISTSNVVAPLGAYRIGRTDVGWYDRTLVARGLFEFAFDSGWMNRDHICVANKLADGLTGGTLAGSLGGPMLFVYNADWMGEHTEAVVQMARLNCTDLYIIGGPYSMPSTVEGQLLEITGHPGASWSP